MPGTFIQERLDALHEVDAKVVQLLDNISTLLEHYTDNDKSITTQTSNIYDLLGNIAIELRKEVKAMDSNIGVYNNRDNVMILPITVDQKNTVLGRKKLDDELDQLHRLEQTTKDPPRHISMQEADVSGIAPDDVALVIDADTKIKTENDSSNLHDSSMEVDMV
ncbi:mediator of RNA polymerase II transcription subunit 11 [Diutina catenulata]